MKISLWNPLLVEWIYSSKNKTFLKLVMNIKWGNSNISLSMNLADNDKCHIALPGPSHSVLGSALNN